MGSICQVGAVRFSGGVIVDERMWLANPKQTFDPINISIHGICESDVEDSPELPPVLAELRDFVGEAVAVSHTHFDRVAIGQVCGAHQLDPFSCSWLDSARVARRTWPEVSQRGYGLRALAERFGIQFRHHDALEDARTAGVILQKAFDESGVDAVGWLDRCNTAITSQGSVARAGSGEGPLVGECIVFTGSLAIPRRQAADRAAALGAEVTTTVSKKTTLVVVGDQDLDKLLGHTKSSKHRKAEQLIADGLPLRILAEQDFSAF